MQDRSKNVQQSRQLQKTLGLVAAAGLSSRMGRHKATLPWRGTVLAMYLVEELYRGGCSHIVLCLPETLYARREMWEAYIQHSHPHLQTCVSIVENQEPTQGLLGSIRTAIHIARRESYPQLVHTPVDSLFVDAKSVTDLLLCQHNHIKNLDTYPSVNSFAWVTVVKNMDGTTTETKYAHPVLWQSDAWSLLENPLCEQAGARTALQYLAAQQKLGFSLQSQQKYLYNCNDEQSYQHALLVDGQNSEDVSKDLHASAQSNATKNSTTEHTAEHQRLLRGLAAMTI